MKRTPALLIGSLIGLMPLVAAAQSLVPADAAAQGVQHAPGNVNLGASELASFVLSAVALVVSGIALARTRKLRTHRTEHQ